MRTRIARRCAVMLALVNTVIAASAPYERVFAAEVQEQQGGPGAFEFVLAGMRRERDRLASGICSLEAIRRAEDGEEMRSQGTLVIDGDKVRYELTRPGWVVNPDTIEETGDGHAAAETMLGMHSLKLAYDGALISFWHSENNLITVDPKELDEEHRRIAQYFDIRGVVLYDPLSIQDGQSLKHQFERLERLSTLIGSDVTMEDHPIWVLRWTIPTEYFDNRWNLCVDVKSGFTPISLLCEDRPNKSFLEKRAQMIAELGDGPVPEGVAEQIKQGDEMLRVLQDDPEAWFLVYEKTANWEQRDGVWVPVSHEVRYGGERASQTSYTFRWGEINQPVDADTFSWTTFDLPEDVPVQYLCLENPRWIRPPRQQSGVAAHGPGPRRLIVAFAVTALALLAAYGAHWIVSRRLSV